MFLYTYIGKSILKQIKRHNACCFAVLPLARSLPIQKQNNPPAPLPLSGRYTSLSSLRSFTYEHRSQPTSALFRKAVRCWLLSFGFSRRLRYF